MPHKSSYLLVHYLSAQCQRSSTEGSAIRELKVRVRSQVRSYFFATEKFAFQFVTSCFLCLFSILLEVSSRLLILVISVQYIYFEITINNEDNLNKIC